jgi:4'-phosphopantetheinyl transferase
VTSTLSPGCVHVWRADLDRRPEVDPSALSTADLQRARRFRFDRDRLRWIRCRTILRRLLAGYLGVEPGRIDLTTGPNGKPRVAGPGIEFNVSHAGEAAVLAFALDNPVGVDVEQRGRVRDPLGAAGLVLGRGELERLRALPIGCREGEFLRSWVRYEAAVKCRGVRLGAPARRSDLHLIDLEIDPCSVAAVALGRAPVSVLVRDVDPDRARTRPVEIPA